MRTSALLVMVLAAMALTPGTTGAAVTIGSNLGGTGEDNCTGTCTAVNVDLPASSRAANGLTSPIGGVVVRWRVKSGSTGDGVALRVLRPVGPTTFTGAGAGPFETLSGAVDEFGIRLPIRAGDSVGLDATNDKLVFANTAGANSVFWSGGLANGATAAGTAQNGKELLVQAVVEADADGDGFGDETQDGCPGDAARQTPPCGAGPLNPGGNPPPTPADTTKPVVLGVAVSPRAFRLGRRTRITFAVSEISRVTLAFARLAPGRRRGGRCVPRARAGRRCVAALRRGSVSVRAQGRLAVSFDGRVTARLLAPGRYRITFTARDLAGNVSASRRATFTLLPRARRR